MFILLFISCTLQEKDFSYTNSQVKISINGSLFQDTAISDYIVCLYSDTTDIFNKYPDYILHPKVKYSLRTDSLENGYWAIIKKWVNETDRVNIYVSEIYRFQPEFPSTIREISFNIPPLYLHQKNINAEVEEIDINFVAYPQTLGYKPWDQLGDDDVSNSAPDVYFTFDTVYSSPVPFAIDATKAIHYIPPGKLTFPAYAKHQFNIMDYDFNTSADDVMYSHNVVFAPPMNKEQLWCKEISIDSPTNYLTWFSLHVKYY